MRHLILITLSIAASACQGFDATDLFPVAEGGADIGFDFFRREAPMPPGAQAWVGVQKKEDRDADVNACVQSPLSPGCSTGGVSIVQMQIIDTESSSPAVADVIDIEQDADGVGPKNRILIRADSVGDTTISVDAVRTSGDRESLWGAHGVVVRDPTDIFAVAHCGARQFRLLLPGSVGAGGESLTTLDELVLLPRAAAGVGAHSVGLQADGSFMSGDLPVELDRAITDVQEVPPGEYDVSFASTDTRIRVSVISEDEVDGLDFVPLSVVRLPGDPDFARVPAIRVPLEADEVSWPGDARTATTILPVSTAGGRIVCSYDNGVPEDVPLPTMTSLTPEVCEVTTVNQQRASVEHLSVGECEVEIEFQGDVDTVGWTIE